MLAGVPVALGQFSSGSNGSDGALNLTTPGTIVFDPKTFNPALDPDGDNIYHFTTINIGAGVTVKLRGDIINGPVFWLAQGAVTINGTIDLSGDQGHLAPSSPAERKYSTPGPGGYAGGPSGQAGLGPGGGGQTCYVQNSGWRGSPGKFTGNQFLVPLIGGSGGSGGFFWPTSALTGGGAGGGAILLASSTSISVNGSIRADGGAPGNTSEAGGGAGGAVRLVASTVSGTGSITVATTGTNSCGASGDLGIIRLEAVTFSGTLPGTRATPFNLFLPTTPTSVRVTSVAGVPVSPSPTGSFTMPDVTINSGSAVPFAIEAKNIPVGTVVTLQVISENGADQTANASPLAGTLALSTATANVTLPTGFSRGFVRATWTQ